MTKQIIIDAAYSSLSGAYVDTDGEWCCCSDPDSLARFIGSLGFTITKAYATSYSNAIVETQEGFKIAYNGACSRIS